MLLKFEKIFSVALVNSMKTIASSVLRCSTYRVETGSRLSFQPIVCYKNNFSARLIINFYDIDPNSSVKGRQKTSMIGAFLSSRLKWIFG